MRERTTDAVIRIRDLSAEQIRDELEKIYPGEVEISVDRNKNDRRLIVFSLPGIAPTLTVNGNRILCVSKLMNRRVILRVRDKFPHHRCTYRHSSLGYQLRIQEYDHITVEALLDSISVMEYVAKKVELVENG